MNPLALEIKNVEFSYGEQKILSIPELEIQSGQMVFLFGPSGSGKSTLLELLAGVLKPNSGDLILNGENLSRLNMAELDHFRAANIGYIFQNFNLIPFLTVLENIQLPFLFQTTNFDSTLLSHLVDRLGLTQFVDRSVSQLSVGQQQRVAVARALLKKPKLILADEPTSALDYDHREGFLKLLFELSRQERTTVLFVSHDRTIEKLFDRAVNLKEINKVQS